MVEKAKRQLTLAGNADPGEWQNLHKVESHLVKCIDARRIRDWKSALREADAAIANGADASQLVMYLSGLIANGIAHPKDIQSFSFYYVVIA
jgi:DnaJ family protein C protein 7